MDIKELLTEKECESAVVAIAQQEGSIKAAKLMKRNGVFKMLWMKETEDGLDKLADFASQCGIDKTGTLPVEDSSDTVVVGFDSSSLVFYYFQVPAVKYSELDALVRLQAESRLPLPAEQMELAWRAGEVRDGQVGVTVVAGRRDQLQGFVERIRSLSPTKILLDCEAMIKSWTVFFSGTDKEAVVISIGKRVTQLCLTRAARLVNAVCLDMGMDDINARGQMQEPVGPVERFCQDVGSVLELFGYGEPRDVRVFVLSDGSSSVENVVSGLRSSGFNAVAAVPNVRKLKELGVDSADVYRYRIPIGLAAMELDDDVGVKQLNVFAGLYEPEGQKAKQRWYYSPRITGILAALMLIAFFSTGYFTAVATNRHLGELLEQKINYQNLMERQKLLKVVAHERLDLLELLTHVNSAEHEGVLLHMLDFKKGRPIRISGQAGNAEQAFKFQESLEDLSGIRQVEIRPSPAKEGEKVNFDITFHYKNFTTKRTNF